MGKYKRVVLKISGEALSGKIGHGFDKHVLKDIARQIFELQKSGLEVAVVVGGGNFWRGRMDESMDRTTADYMGMLATAINALAIQDALESQGATVRVMTAIEMNKIAEPYIRRRAMHHLEKGIILIFACGSGNPYFSTDTAAALRAAEIDADVFMKATNVDGIYTKDPAKYDDAEKIEEIGYMDFLNQGFGVILDSTAVSLCMDNKIPIIVFSMQKEGNIKRVSEGEHIGSLIKDI